MPELQYRAVEFRAAEADDNTVPCTVSSEEPVERGDFIEILSHEPAHIDLSRAPLPLIVQHDSRQLNVGVVEGLRIEGRKLRGLARFGSSDLAQQILKDVKDGIVRSLSVGYLLLEPVKEIGRTVRFAWQPYEASLVSVPADSQAGFYRSLKGPAMTDYTATENDSGLTRSQRRGVATGVKAERDRAMFIRDIGREIGMAEQAERAIDNGTSVDDFKEAMLARIRPAGKIIPAESPDIGLTPREIEQYSVRRAILGLMDPAYAMREGSFEVAASRAMAERLGRQPQGVFVPHDVLNAPRQRDMMTSTPSYGGNLVGTQHDGASFVELLRERNLALEFGATLLGGLTGNLAIPTQTGPATGFWITEGGAPTESQQVFGQVLLTPKTVGAFTDYSRKMLLQGSPDVESLIRADLAAVLANELDRAVFNGSGVGAEPRGILNQSGVGSVPIGTDGGAITWDHLLELERFLVAAHSVDLGGVAYVTTPAVRKKLKGTTKVSGDAGAGFIWENGAEGSLGMLNGYKAGATTHLPSNLTKGTGTALSAMILGNWPDMLIGMWGGLDLLLDPYSLSTSGGRRIVALLDCDVAMRRAASFAVCKDIATT